MEFRSKEEGGGAKEEGGGANFSKTRMCINVNGRNITITKPDKEMRLVDFIRNVVGLKGTKVVCREGGCGACTVLVSKEDPKLNPVSIKTVNSCLIPLIALDGYFVITIERLGSHKDRLSNIQTNMVEKFGMQCGFCTAGVIMNGLGNMAKQPLNMEKDPRKVFDGNICRCTGYRPIMEAMRSTVKCFSVADIEDICSRKPTTRGQDENISISNEISAKEEPSFWYQPQSMNEFFEVVSLCKGRTTEIINGNTSRGIYKRKKKTDITILLNRISELQLIRNTESHIYIGASITLSQMISKLEEFSTMAPVADHIKKIANNAVRNAATWAGNLMLVHQHRNFQSDIFILLKIANCVLTLVDYERNTIKCDLSQFLLCDMGDKIIVSLCIDIFPKEDKFMSFKVMPRHQSCYAYVNAAFLGSTDPETITLTKKPSLVFGAFGFEPIHAVNTEKYLDDVRRKGLPLNDNSILQDCCRILQDEIHPVETITGPSKQYRKQVAINLFYKFYLLLVGEKADEKHRSAILKNDDSIFHSEQSFPMREHKFPLTKPIPRIDSDLLVSGKTEYTADVPSFTDEVFIAFILAGEASATFVGLDIEKAKKMPGFIDIITNEDIPGSNAVCEPYKYHFDEILCSTEIMFAGQAVGIAVADTQVHANEIADVVQVKVKNKRKPVLNVKESIQQEMFFPNNEPHIIVGDTQKSFEKCDFIIEGELEIASMHHFYLEPQTSAVVIREKEVEVYSSTQFASGVQEGVAKILGINANKVSVFNQKCGGGFGGKSRASVQVAAAAAVTAHILERPVRISLDYSTDMKLNGSRAPFLFQYKVGFSKDGLLQAIDVDAFADIGAGDHNTDVHCVKYYIDSAYYCPNWNVRITKCKTHKSPNIALRGPGFSQARFFIETVMEQISGFLGKSSDVVREMNLYKDGQTLEFFQNVPLEPGKLENSWNDILLKSDYHNRKRETASFNKNNRWRKRGISLLPMLYRHRYHGFYYTVAMSILYADSTVVLYHGGSEIGQGINTRMAQLAARWLGVPHELVRIGTNSTRTTPNSAHTAASVTSEMVGMGVIKCCQILNERLKSIKEEFPHYSWSQLIAMCTKRRVDLSVTYLFDDKDKEHFAYSNYAAVCSEAEVDILTGETTLTRTDIIFDGGESINPGIDIGQLEGAFVTGIGQYLQEKIIFHPETGQELTSGTWEYHPPLAMDIPSDFRVHLSDVSANQANAIGSKGIGEPSLGMALSCMFAARSAVEEARKDAGEQGYFRIDAPATIDELQQQTGWKLENLTL